MPTPLFEILLDAIYPPTCIQCETDGAWVCANCLARVGFIHAHPDPNLLVLGAYANPVLRKLLTNLKYRSATCLVEPLTSLFRAWRLQAPAGAWPWAGEASLHLCAIPSDIRRVRERGVDHAAYLEQIVWTELVPWAKRSKLLRRMKYVVPNASLPHHAIRQMNVKDVFAATSHIQGAVLLIDDVYTTGATWQAASEVLRAAGASQIYGLVLAKG